MGFDIPDALIRTARVNAADLLHDEVELFRDVDMGVDALGGRVTERILVGRLAAHFAPVLQTSDLTDDQSAANVRAVMEFHVESDIRVGDRVVFGDKCFRVVEVRGITHAAIYKQVDVVQEER